MDFIIWLVVAAFMIVIELATLGLTTIWFAGGAIAAAIAAVLGANWIIQMLIFAVLSLVLLIFTRPIAAKLLVKTEDTNIDSYIGKEVLVLAPIEKSKDGGLVRMNGLEWSAETNDDTVLAEGSYVYVKAIEGNRLIVSEKE